MDKELALMEQRINILSDTAHRYTYAFDILMEHFELLPNDVQKEIDKKLKEIDL